MLNELGFLFMIRLGTCMQLQRRKWGVNIFVILVYIFQFKLLEFDGIYLQLKYYRLYLDRWHEIINTFCSLL